MNPDPLPAGQGLDPILDPLPTGEALIPVWIRIQGGREELFSAGGQSGQPSSTSE